MTWEGAAQKVSERLSAPPQAFSLQQPPSYRWNHRGSTRVIHCHCRCSNSQSASILRALLKTPASQGSAWRRSLSSPFTILKSSFEVRRCLSSSLPFQSGTAQTKTRKADTCNVLLRLSLYMEYCVSRNTCAYIIKGFKFPL